MSRPHQRVRVDPQARQRHIRHDAVGTIGPERTNLVPVSGELAAGLELHLKRKGSRAMLRTVCIQLGSSKPDKESAVDLWRAPNGNGMCFASAAVVLRCGLTLSLLLPKAAPFILAMAFSACSREMKVTKPNPRLSPLETARDAGARGAVQGPSAFGCDGFGQTYEFRSFITLHCRIGPKTMKCSYSVSVRQPLGR
eukprot:scaffold417_cov252-Pinguiococcus_pyrenoidosus.AAC.33